MHEWGIGLLIGVIVLILVGITLIDRAVEGLEEVRVQDRIAEAIDKALERQHMNKLLEDDPCLRKELEKQGIIRN